MRWKWSARASSPREGIAFYCNDPTQGPKCALACPGGTVFRNYLVNKRGQGDTQIDLLADVGRVLGNTDECYWTMQNGYAMPVAMRDLAQKLEASPRLIEEAEAALRVGVHWRRRPGRRTRTASARSTRRLCLLRTEPRRGRPSGSPSRGLVLRAAYEATLAVGALKARDAGRRQAVYLTSLGGGAFGNRDAWITEAVRGALHKFPKDAPLDVYKVHYGTRVQSAWRDVGGSIPEPTTGEKQAMAPPAAKLGPAPDPRRSFFVFLDSNRRPRPILPRTGPPRPCREASSATSCTRRFGAPQTSKTRANPA